jgi:proteic killer suppression protein
LGRAKAVEDRRFQDMIQSFGDHQTEELFRYERSRRFATIARVALRKLIQINQVRALTDLAVPPGNRLEALRGNWRGCHSIRINQQGRIVCVGPTDVAIVDHH